MTRAELQQRALDLPEDDRRELASVLWESVDIPRWHKELLEERLAADDARPDEVVTWTEVEHELFGRP